MIALFLNFIIHIVIGFLTKGIIDSQYITISFIFTTSVIVLLLTLMNFEDLFIYILLAYTFRLVIMIYDLYNPGTILHSGDDTENFFKTGVEISNNLSLLFSDIYGGMYSKFIGIIFYLYGVDRLFIQFLNILFFVFSILLIRKIIILLSIENYKNLLVIILFFPHSLIFSSILHRESLISFLLIMSFYFFLKWVKQQNYIYASICLLIVMLAALFHSGVIGLAVGYSVGFIIIAESENKVLLNNQKKIILFFITLITLSLIVFKENILDLPFLNKFQQYLETNETIYDITNVNKGNTTYLSSLEIDTPLDLIIYSPLKLIYFIISPVPWEIKSLSTMLAFSLDGLFYLIIMLYIVKYYKVIIRNPLLLSIFIGIFTTYLIFSIGVSNAGTAIRHRFKLFNLIMLFIFLVYKKKKEKLK